VAGVDDDEVGAAALLDEHRAPFAGHDPRLDEVVVTEDVRDVVGQARQLVAAGAVVRDDRRHAAAGRGLRCVGPPGSHCDDAAAPE
jgi:hypothetical protein